MGPLTIVVIGIIGLVFDEQLPDGLIRVVIGVLFVAFRKTLARLDEQHRRWVWRMNPTERSVKVTEAMMVVIGLGFVGIGALTLAAH